MTRRETYCFRLGLAAGAFLGALVWAALCDAQPPAAPLSGTKVVLVSPLVRAQLAAAWDSARVGSSERIYCTLYTTDTTPQSRVVVYRVFAALPAAMDSASPTRGYGRCPGSIPDKGVTISSLHTHPAFTCYGTDGRSDCVAGGVWAFDCTHSDLDSATYRANHLPFALVQCDRHAFVPWFAPPPGKQKAEGKRWRVGWRTVRDGVTVAAAIPAGHLDHDAGGGERRYLARDKAWHALGGVLLGLGTAHTWTPCITAGVFELAQGFAEPRDFVVTCGSAVATKLAIRGARAIW